MRKVSWIQEKGHKLNDCRNDWLKPVLRNWSGSGYKRFGFGSQKVRIRITKGLDPDYKRFGSRSQKGFIRIRITNFLIRIRITQLVWIRILVAKGLDPNHKRFGSAAALTETQVLKNPPGRMSDSWVNGRGVYRKISQSKGGSTHLDFWSHHGGAEDFSSHKSVRNWIRLCEYGDLRRYIYSTRMKCSKIPTRCICWS